MQSAISRPYLFRDAIMPMKMLDAFSCSFKANTLADGDLYIDHKTRILSVNSFCLIPHKRLFWPIGGRFSGRIEKWKRGLDRSR